MGYREDFINYLKPYAQAMEAKYGIDWRIPVAQAILETGWGQYNRHWNLWGMRYEGPAGRDAEGYALFHDQWEAIEAYIYNVRKHHQTAWEVRNDPQKFFQEIQSQRKPNTGAWAEDPQYTQKLNRIFQQYLSGETTAVDPTQPPQENLDTLPIYFPKTDQKIKPLQKDYKGAITQQKRYYVKLQHVDADEEPQGALTIKISPDSQFLVVREKLAPLEEQKEEGNNNSEGNQGNNQQTQVPQELSQVSKDFQVVESGSFQLQVDGVLLDYHNSGGEKKKEVQKVTNQIQLRADYLGITRIKEGKKKKSDSIILGDDLVQIEVNNEESKSRIEVNPRRLLFKASKGKGSNAENDYIRIEEDTIQAKNKSKSQIFMKEDLLVAENKTGSKLYIRGDLVRAECKSGSYVRVFDDAIEAKNKSGSYVEVIGDTILIENKSGSHITVSGGTITIKAPLIVIDGGVVDVKGSPIKLNS